MADHVEIDLKVRVIPKASNPEAPPMILVDVLKVDVQRLPKPKKRKWFRRG